MRGETDRPRHASDRVRVAHDVSDLPEDENNGLILTLQDQPIIGGSNQTILENPKLMADYKRDFHKHIQEKLKGAHDPLDDFFRGRILAKYDEHNPEKEGFELDDEGKLALDDKMDFEHMPKEGLYDLEVRKEIQSDYFTADELKSGPVKIKKRSKKSITEIYPDNSEAHLGTGLGSKATRDFSFLRLVDEEEEEQEEMLGKRTQKSGMGTDIEQDRKVKEEKYTNSMREATENMRKSTAFAEIQQKEQEDLFLLQQLMKNNKRLAEEKAKKAAEKIKELTRKPEEPAEQGDFVTLDKIEAPKEKHQDLKSIVAKAKQAEDPFKPLEK
jgi:hypothetical protein